jgi:hypothetical protein
MKPREKYVDLDGKEYSLAGVGAVVLVSIRPPP